MLQLVLTHSPEFSWHGFLYCVGEVLAIFLLGGSFLHAFALQASEAVMCRSIWESAADQLTGHNPSPSNG